MKLIINQLCRFSLFLYCIFCLLACETVKKTYQVWSDPDIQVGSRQDQPSLYSLSIYATNRINMNAYADNLNEEDTEDEDFDVSPDDDIDFAEDQSRIDGSEMAEKINQKINKKQLVVAEDDGQIIEEEALGESLEATPVSLVIVQLAEKSLFLSATYDELNIKKFEKNLGKTYLEHEELMLDPNQFRFFENKKMEEGTRYIGVVAYFNDEVNSQWRDVIKVRGNGETYPLLIRVSENNISLYKDN